jgi:hypothetical protein
MKRVRELICLHGENTKLMIGVSEEAAKAFNDTVVALGELVEFRGSDKELLALDRK